MGPKCPNETRDGPLHDRHRAHIKYIKELKLPTVRDSLDDIVSDAAAEKWDYRKFLRVLFEREVEQRFENRKYIRIRKAPNSSSI